MCRLQPAIRLGIAGDVLCRDQREQERRRAADEAAEPLAQRRAEEAVDIGGAEPGRKARHDETGVAAGGAEAGLFRLNHGDAGAACPAGFSHRILAAGASVVVDGKSYLSPHDARARRRPVK